MSIRVALDELDAATAGRSLAYLATADATSIRVVQCHPRHVDGTWHVAVGSGSLRQVAQRSDVVIMYPPAPDDPQQFTLLIDGVAEVVDDTHLAVRPRSAVLHRRADS